VSNTKGGDRLDEQLQIALLKAEVKELRKLLQERTDELIKTRVEFLTGIEYEQPEQQEDE